MKNDESGKNIDFLIKKLLTKDEFDFFKKIIKSRGRLDEDLLKCLK